MANREGLHIEIIAPGLHVVTSDPEIARLAVDDADRRTTMPLECVRCHGPIPGAHRGQVYCAGCSWTLLGGEPRG